MKESNPESIAGALDPLSRRGRRLVEQRFAWPKAAAQMMRSSCTVLEDGEKPECLVA